MPSALRQHMKTLIYLCFVSMFFGVLVRKIAFSRKLFPNEFGHHLRFARRMVESGHILVPHFLDGGMGGSPASRGVVRSLCRQ
jgi:hypothetical protein